VRVIGIDPGATGAIALIDTDYPENTMVWDLEASISASTKTVSGRALAERLADTWSVECIFVEEVHANTMSYKGNFTLGMATGIILGVCTALERPVRRIKPKEWQKDMGLSNIDAVFRKDAHRARAMEMWPHLSEQLKRKKDHNRADALLIAEAGRRTL
jgi:crossover junction endodeoxyribonuclease RuvC